MNLPGVQAAFAELRKRPDIEDVEVGYLDLLTALRTSLVDEVGVRAWMNRVQLANVSGGVGEYAALGEDAEVRRYHAGVSPGAIRDTDWPGARSLVAGVVRRGGFGAATVVVERPGDHEVSFMDTYGAELLFGTAVNTTLGLSTGCHLTRRAHQRSVPGSGSVVPGGSP
ncbi:LppA family lipoprotein [Actinopolymorpha sp. B17G11]|uniref:LppA family lipoprotein n=1 Tax=unclassified Actinopolymorpha TaxID=2627063 RepID=UPI0032D9544C